MESSLRYLILTLIISKCYPWQYWDDLGVTWDANFLLFPTKLPRTTNDAWHEGWNQIDTECAGDKGYEGFAWMNSDYDPAVTLLFDNKGYIAGIQAGILFSDHEALGFPHEKQTPPFVQAKNRYVISAYFIEPEKICSSGRTREEFRKQGTGTDLYLQNGNEILAIPRKQKNLSGPWIEGKCWITMGKHYWYAIYDDMDCDQFFPFFILYNGGSLNAFGWAFTANLTSSNYYTRITPRQHDLTMKEVPRCLRDIEVMATMRVFLTRNPALNFC